MNRVDRALEDAKVLPVSRKVALEALKLADELVRDRKERSLAAARTSAARTVAARYKTMPGPIFLAINKLVAERGDWRELDAEAIRAEGSGQLAAVDPRPGARPPDRGGPTGPAASLEWHDEYDE